MSIIFRGPTSPRVLAYIPFHELDIIISRAFQKVKQTLAQKDPTITGYIQIPFLSGSVNRHRFLSV